MQRRQPFSNREQWTRALLNEDTYSRQRFDINDEYCLWTTLTAQNCQNCKKNVCFPLNDNWWEMQRSCEEAKIEKIIKNYNIFLFSAFFSN